MGHIACRELAIANVALHTFMQVEGLLLPNRGVLPFLCQAGDIGTGLGAKIEQHQVHEGLASPHIEQECCIHKWYTKLSGEGKRAWKQH